MEVPSDVFGRFVAIPKGKDPQGKVYILLDDVIRACLPRAFRGVFDIQSADAYCFKFSRDAELEIEASINESLIEKMASSLRQRRKADAVRFVYDATMPEPLLEHLRKRLGFGRYDSLIPGGRYHNSKDYIGFPNAGPKYLEFKPQTPIRIPELDAVDNIFTALREKDYLLYYPYHPFDYVVDVLKTAAIDPSVTAIKICLYRVASNSQIVDALINAQYNGKRVRVVVELAARFDEQANIAWSERLTEAGIEVIFGIPGLKVHSKLFLIDRMEQGKLVRYSHIGTGNFNEKTARLRFMGDDKWQLRNGDEVLGDYDWSELRYSISWKGYCFKDETDENLWHSGSDDLSIDFILNRIADALRAQGVLTGARPDPTAFATMMVNHYIRFPKLQAAAE